MFNIVLFEPEIPPNTGNIIRLCVNTNSNLHLIKPLGFDLHEKKVRRAGLDYHDMAKVFLYNNFNECLEKLKDNRFFAVSTKAKERFNKFNYVAGDVFVFGPETRGLPDKLLNSPDFEKIIRIPMYKNNRSLNLSNSVAIILYEAWSQTDFKFGS